RVWAAVVTRGRGATHPRRVPPDAGRVRRAEPEAAGARGLGAPWLVDRAAPLRVRGARACARATRRGRAAAAGQRGVLWAAGDPCGGGGGHLVSRGSARGAADSARVAGRAASSLWCKLARRDRLGARGGGTRGAGVRRQALG